MATKNDSRKRKVEGMMTRSGIAMAAVTALAGSTVHGADLFWGSGGVNNAWTTASFWYTDAAETAVSPAVPTVSDNVFFNTTPDNTVGGTVTMAANIFANSLTFNTTGGTTLSQSGNRSLTLGTGGVTVNSGAGNSTIGVSTNSLAIELTGDQTWTNNAASTLNPRLLRVSNTAAGPVTVTFNAASTGNITFSLGITNSPDTLKSLGVVVDSAGSGFVNFAGGSYTGGTLVKRGIASTNGTLGTGSIVLSDADGTQDTRLNGTGVITNNITVNSGTGMRALTGSGTGDFQGNITLNRDIEIGAVATSGQTLKVSGNISGAHNITIGRVGTGTSNPTVTMTGDSTYTGRTYIPSATLVVDSFNSVSGGSASSALGTPTTVANGTLSFSAVSASTLRYTGEGETTDRVIDLAGTTNGLSIYQDGTGLLKFTSDFTATGSGAKTLTLRGASDGTGEISGVIPNSTTNTGLQKLDSGTWRLSGLNTYTGTTTIGGGVLEVTKLANTNNPSSIGAPSSSVGPTVLNGAATLRYIGTGDSTNRVFTIGGGGGGSLDASGTGAIVFSSSSSSAFGSSNVAYTLNLIGSNTDNNTYAANQSNNGTGAFSITKAGTGTWVLSGTSTYTGPTLVNGGKLVVGNGVSGSLVNSSVTVADTATLSGSGSIGGAVVVQSGGTLAPGNSPGIIGTGNLTLDAGSDLAVELNGTTAGTLHDMVSVNGTVSLAGDLVATLGYTPTLGDKLFVINNNDTDAVTGGFANLTGGTIDLTYNSTAYRFTVSYVGDFSTLSDTGGNDVVLTNTVIPEPAMLSVIGIAAAGLLRRRRGV